MKHNWEYKKLREIAPAKPFKGKVSSKNGEYWCLNLDKIQSNTGIILNYDFVEEAELCGSVHKFSKDNVLFSKLRPNLNKVVVPEQNGYCTTELVPLLPGKELNRYFLGYYLRNPYYVEFLVGKTGGAKMPRVKMDAFWDSIVPMPPMEVQEQIVAELDKINEVIADCRKLLRKLDTLAESLFYDYFGDIYHNPKGWPVCKLGDVSEKISNGANTKIELDTYKHEGIMFFRCQNVWRNRFDLSDVVYVDEEINTKMKGSVLKHNDLLVTKIGRLFTENSSLGRVALYEGEDDKANLSGNLSFIRLKSNVAPKFVLYIMISDYFREYVRNTTSGGIDKRALNNSQLKDLPIYLPPLALQKKFVERIEAIEKQKVAIEETIKKMQTLLDSRMDYWFN